MMTNTHGCALPAEETHLAENAYVHFRDSLYVPLLLFSNLNHLYPPTTRDSTPVPGPVALCCGCRKILFSDIQELLQYFLLLLLYPAWEIQHDFLFYGELNNLLFCIVYAFLFSLLTNLIILVFKYYQLFLALSRL